MLKFLTHKLKSHTLNEDHLDNYKGDDDHDSGTESDDENGDTEDQESIMESEAERSSESTVSPDPYTVATNTSNGAYFPDSALPSDSDLNYDHHSSEEELEVINNKTKCVVVSGVGVSGVGGKSVKEMTIAACRSGSVTVPEKRKWSQITSTVCTVSEPCIAVASTSEAASSGVAVTVTTVATAEHSSGSSDEEVQGLLAAMATPVQFRSSPPSNAHKPGHRSLSPPPKLFHYGGHAALEVSPRKRHRHTPRPQHIQRPCLDFEKMQQLKARAVTAWRHGSDHGGELSVFCW